MNSELSAILIESLKATNNPVTVTDALAPDNPIIYCNEAFTSLTGYDEQEVVGRNCRFLQGEDSDSKTVDQIRQAVARGESCEVTLLNYRKDGTAFWNDLQITPLKNDDGNVTHFFGFQTNISERLEKERVAALVEKLEAELHLDDIKARHEAAIDKTKTQLQAFVTAELHDALVKSIDNLKSLPANEATDETIVMLEKGLYSIDGFIDTLNSQS